MVVVITVMVVVVLAVVVLVVVVVVVMNRVSFMKHSSGRGRRGPRGGQKKNPEWSQ